MARKNTETETETKAEAETLQVIDNTEAREVPQASAKTEVYEIADGFKVVNYF